MTLIFLLLKVLLACILAYLGGPFLRNIRGLCPENSAAALRRDRLLGLALYLVSVFTGAVTAIRLATWSPSGLLLAGFAVLWGVAVWLGLRKKASLAAVKIVGGAAVVVLAAVVVAANGAITGADLFLLIGALAWLGATLWSPPRALH